MAYDPKDSADKKIVDKLIADAIAEAAADTDNEIHEPAIARLKAKNLELIDKLRKAKGGEPADIERLETELETVRAELKTANKSVKDLTKERDTFKTTAESETNASRKFIVDQGLTEHLVANKVPSQFLPAVKKLLADQVTIKQDGENRVAMVGDKTLGDFVKAWSQGDEGKNFVTATVNGGGGSPGGKASGNGTSKTLARSAFDQLAQFDRAQFAKDGGKVVDG